MAEEYGLERNGEGKFLPGNKAGAGRGPNKVSTKVRESIVKFLEDNVDTVQASFDTLKPKEKLEFIQNILSYAAPKLSSIQVDQETNISGGITIKWEEPRVQNSVHKGSNGELSGVQGGLPDNS